MKSLDSLARTGRGLQARSLRKAGRAGKRLPYLLFFTDPLRTPRPRDVIARLPRGSGVVFRAFGAADAIVQGRKLATLARRRGVAFFVGADVGLAIALNADGVHLPERLTGRAGGCRALRRRFWLTAAAHSLPAILKAERAGVDGLVVSPVFASQSPSAGRPLGVLAFARLVRLAASPVYPLGGVNAGSARRLTTSGAHGLAAIEGLMEGVGDGDRR